MGDSANTATHKALDETQIAERVSLLADEIAETCSGDDFALVGVYTRGVTLAQRIVEQLEKKGLSVPLGKLDVSLYRDDFDQLDRVPRLHSTEIPFTLEEKRIIIVDEVMYTGRTTRAAISGLLDYGRPAKVELAVLIDRGNRELPLQPDYYGKKLKTTRDEYVRVHFADNDEGDEGVYITQK